MLIQLLCGACSGRQSMKQVRYNLLLRWPIGLAVDGYGLGANDLHDETQAIDPSLFGYLIVQ
ncbi:hypothetical protein [Burkholderia pseudomallei]|uniref:hypothetical protein n=1 Tax=Burkholderia pseudomallei TaxID=28450 RepID=UPI0012FE88E5